jgi:hypothetical protein
MDKHSGNPRNPERVVGVCTATPYRGKHVSIKGTKKTAPAKKRRIPEACGQPGLSTNEKNTYHVRITIQGDSRIEVWNAESGRLLEEWQKTGKEIHRSAFENHMAAILALSTKKV